MSKLVTFVIAVAIVTAACVAIVAPTSYVVVMLGDNYADREMLRDLGFWSAMVHALNLALPGMLGLILFHWCYASFVKWAKGYLPADDDDTPAGGIGEHIVQGTITPGQIKVGSITTDTILPGDLPGGPRGPRTV